jgi:hypothetical protein
MGELLAHVRGKKCRFLDWEIAGRGPWQTEAYGCPCVYVKIMPGC